jgi:pimeloyl-ACP methyl ester carboxylesterase
MGEFTVSNTAELSGEQSGDGPPVVLLHGLTATRNYVIHGSKALERAGHRVIAYDARGHGRSSGGPHYDYATLAADLNAVMDASGVEEAVLAGASMGAHTAVRFALDQPERVRALVVITPAFDPDATPDTARWDRLADGLANGGVEGFLEAYGPPAVPERWRETVERIIRRRMGEHEHPDALADALRGVPRSRPFEAWDDLARIEVPALVVASQDDADPEHPLHIGERYATTMPAARLVTESPGDSPLAWQGGRLARAIAGTT